MAGGFCTGKSTLAARVFSELKVAGLDYDLVQEQKRQLHKEFGQYTSILDRFYMVIKQLEAEARSTATDGFVTDYPLFHFHIHALQYADTEKERDKLAIVDLFKVGLETGKNYHLIVLAQNPLEIPFAVDGARSSNAETARRHHDLSVHFLETHFKSKLLYVSGTLEERTKAVVDEVNKRRSEIRT